MILPVVQRNGRRETTLTQMIICTVHPGDPTKYLKSFSVYLLLPFLERECLLYDKVELTPNPLVPQTDPPSSDFHPHLDGRFPPRIRENVSTFGRNDPGFR